MSAITPTILASGQALPPTYQLLSLDVRKEVNRIPRAQLVFHDGDPPQRTFPVSDSGDLDPGTEVEIKLRYEGETEDETVFKGLVLRHHIEATPRSSVLVVELRDEAVKLTQPRKSVVHLEKTDDAIFGDIIEGGGLEPGTVESTSPEHPEIVQYRTSDWDFMLSRAEALGMLVNVDDGVVSVKKIAIEGASEHPFDYGLMDMYDFEVQLDALSQVSGVQSFGWDIGAQAPTEATEAADFALSQGDLDGGDAAGTVGFAPCELKHAVTLDPDELQGWADGRLARSRLSWVRGRVSVPGSATIKTLDVGVLDGMGTHFQGTALITGVRHRVDANGWRTDVQLGLHSRAFPEEHDVTEVEAAGVIPAVSGLQIGLVAAFEEDPDEELRVRVHLPGISADAAEGSVWARLAAPDAGIGRGWYFRPEEGDEVVVGFLNEDPRHPVILGGLYSSVNTPPERLDPPDADNVQRQIVSRAGTIIGFLDDEKAAVFIETPNSNTIVLDDDLELIELSDQHGNTVTMSSDGILIESASDLTIEASGKVEISGSEVDIK